jgi:hypothetical protein
MMRTTRGRRVRIPVRNVNGVWECALGGPVPTIPGAEAELLVDPSNIADRAFLKAMDSAGRHQVLAEGASLLISLTIKRHHPPTEATASHLTRFRDFQGRIATEMLDPWSPDTLAFVEVKLAKATDGAGDRRAKADAGLWLLTQGLKTTGILSGPIALPRPVSPRPASSLNHAVTLLSESYETWRISHTGNAYARVLYRAKDDRWYPLDVLRNVALENQEQAIASQLWDEFMKKITRAQIGRGERA